MSLHNRPTLQWASLRVSGLCLSLDYFASQWWQDSASISPGTVTQDNEVGHVAAAMYMYHRRQISASAACASFVTASMHAACQQQQSDVIHVGKQHVERHMQTVIAVACISRCSIPGQTCIPYQVKHAYQQLMLLANAHERWPPLPAIRAVHEFRMRVKYGSYQYTSQPYVKPLQGSQQKHVSFISRAHTDTLHQQGRLVRAKPCLHMLTQRGVVCIGCNPVSQHVCETAPPGNSIDWHGAMCSKMGLDSS